VFAFEVEWEQCDGFMEEETVEEAIVLFVGVVRGKKDDVLVLQVVTEVGNMPRVGVVIRSQSVGESREMGNVGNVISSNSKVL